MSATVTPPPSPPATSPALALGNVIGSLGSTFAGLAAMAPAVAGMVGTAALPATPIGWVQIAFGVLALFAKA